MSAEANVGSDEEDLANAYQTLSWIGNGISFWTENQRFIRLQYDDDNMMVLNTYKQKMEYHTLVKDLTCKKQKIYIEWVQGTGKYLYYDLLTLVKKAKDATLSLSLLKYDIHDNDCVPPSFDESSSPDKVLTSDDIVILSPVRSFQLQYTAMGTYYNENILYLGPFPTKQFVQQCNVQYLFNCCGYSNDDDIIKLPNVKEFLFDVAAWTVGDVGDDEEDTDDDGKEEEEKNDKYNESMKQKDDINVEYLLMQYLDKQIDLIDGLLRKGNVLVHCLAGAHRSPFITGCYEYKYGTLNGKTPKEIYKWLMSTRDMVQILGFDSYMEDYFAFLQKK